MEWIGRIGVLLVLVFYFIAFDGDGYAELAIIFAWLVAIYVVWLLVLGAVSLYWFLAYDLAIRGDE